MKYREEIKFESDRWKISTLDNTIVRVEIKRHTEVSMDDMDRNFKLYQSFLNGRKLPFLVIFGEFSMANREVQKEFAKSQRGKIKTCEAYVINSLPHRIMGNFYIKFAKPAHPAKIFGNEEEATEWLLKKHKEMGESIDSKSTYCP